MTATVTKISTNRTRAFRDRQKTGLRRFTFTADEVAVKQMLVDANILPSDAWDDDAAVERSLNIFIGFLLRKQQENLLAFRRT